MEILAIILGLFAGGGDKSVDPTSIVAKQLIKGVYDERRVETVATFKEEYPTYKLD
tara:strand:+ start:1778 stop:1945 length:168 start_codon:yes stop_codon:yes gene_type:complete